MSANSSSAVAIDEEKAPLLPTSTPGIRELVKASNENALRRVLKKYSYDTGGSRTTLEHQVLDAVYKYKIPMFEVAKRLDKDGARRFVKQHAPIEMIRALITDMFRPKPTRKRPAIADAAEPWPGPRGTKQTRAITEEAPSDPLEVNAAALSLDAPRKWYAAQFTIQHILDTSFPTRTLEQRMRLTPEATVIGKITFLADCEDWQEQAFREVERQCQLWTCIIEPELRVIYMPRFAEYSDMYLKLLTSLF